MVLFGYDGWLFLLRWFHFLAGITWIGLLYYFNFVQTPFVAETEPAVRSGVTQKLVPRALWWFRWGAMFTIITGWIYLLHHWVGKVGFAAGVGAWAILLGGIMGTIMWANVWFVIWPKQKIVIQNALDTAAGRPANPEAAAALARAGLASRTNVVFSIPMLFYMGAAMHLTLPLPRSGAVFWIVSGIIMALVQANALFATAGRGTAKPLATVKGTLWAGFILAAVVYVWFEIIGVR